MFLSLLKKFSFILLVCFVFVKTYAQEAVFEQLSTLNGLSQNTVRCLMQDRNGFIWVGTINGLNRYDGFRFISYKPNEGKLTDSRIKDLVQDKHGFIWIRGFNNKYYCLNPSTNQFVDYLDKTNPNITFTGLLQTSNGDICLTTSNSGFLYLSYLDGKWITYTVKNRTNKDNSLNDDRVIFTFEDSNHNLWIGTKSSLGYISKMGIQNKSFTVKNYLVNSSHIFTLADEDHNFIHFFTRKGVVVYNKTKQDFSYIESSSNTNIVNAVKFNTNEYLLATTNKGVLLYSTVKKSIIPFPKVIDPGSKIISQIVHDKIGGFWVTNRTGNVWRIDSITKEIRKFNLITSKTLALIDEERIGIITDKQKNVWLSTYGEGLYKYNSYLKTMSHFLYDPSNPGKLSSNYLLTLFCDRFGIVWVGTEHTGINKILYHKDYFQTYYPNNDQNNPSSNFVRSVLQDLSGNIWISTKDGNISVYNSKNEKSKKYTAEFFKSLNIQGNVYCFLQDETTGWLWLGTKGNGVYAFNPDNIKGSIRHFVRDAGNSQSIALDQIYDITQDYRGRLWFATFGGGISLCTNSKTDNPAFVNFFTSTDGVKQVRCILSDSKNNIWLGTSNGVIMFHPDSLIKNPHKNYKYYTNIMEDKTSLSSNEAKVIYEGKNGIIWVGTSNGLNKFIPPTKKVPAHFERYFTYDGLSNDIVQAVTEDKNGNLWIGTENGLSEFNPLTTSFRNYRPSANTMGNLISELAAMKLRSGELVFGSADGFYIVNPENFKADTAIYPITLTNFILSGMPVEPDNVNSALEKAIFQTNEIELSYVQNSFTIEFATLLFDNEHNYFCYKLENYDKEWNKIVNTNSASYKNLSPGKYIFKVKYLNPSGNNSERITQLTIIIRPPLWRSKVAFILYFIIALVILLGIKNIIDRIHKLQHTIEVEKEITEYKIKFFTNISHEFRTPLTLILGSLERIYETMKLTPALHKHILIMQRNTSRLLQLMDQLLYFAKVQNKSMKLNVSQVEVIGLIKSIYNSFSDLAEKKDITYHFSSNIEKSIVYVDPNILDKILYNLLSNAFKFTRESGKIELLVTIDEKNNTLSMVVRDNGEGIPDEKQNLIFKRFAQIQTTTTGIGLSLTRELTELHNGEISFISKLGEGSEFKVILKTNPDLYKEEEINRSDNKQTLNQQPHFLLDESDDLPAIKEMDALNDNKILVVEDNEEIREYLADYLSKYFKVEQAIDGLDGIEKAIEFEPDLIVCDIVMPEMNGIEVTKKLKSDFQTSHIPVLLLTAITSDEMKLDATEAGADEYITKPFNIKYLLTKIFKLIEQRETLRKKFSSDTAPINFTICKTDRDKSFLEKANRIAEQQMINPEFSVDDFAKLAGLGRTVFYKKLKGITGYTPNEFIRIIRMKKALELLGTGDFTVSEVAHKVGMNDPFYFSRCFKSQFGQSPSVYIKGK
jgi:signal transduction histidine kinase/ligand-binding sensor domain-containing protein/DNA-binding response OmpR family regulator